MRNVAGQVVMRGGVRLGRRRLRPLGFPLRTARAGVLLRRVPLRRVPGRGAGFAAAAASSAVVGGTGSALPKPAADGIPVVPAAAAEAAAVPPDRAPSWFSRAGGACGAAAVPAPVGVEAPAPLRELLRFNSHHTTPTITAMTMSQIIQSIAESFCPGGGVAVA